MGMNMDQYIAEFSAKCIDGKRLADLDSCKLKVGKGFNSDAHFNMHAFKKKRNADVLNFVVGVGGVQSERSLYHKEEVERHEEGTGKVGEAAGKEGEGGQTEHW